MDTPSGAVDLSEMEVGDAVLIRNRIEVTQTTANRRFDMRYQIGAGGGAFVEEQTLGRLDSGMGPYHFRLAPDLITIDDENVRDNPLFIQVRLNGIGEVVVRDCTIWALRRS